MRTEGQNPVSARNPCPLLRALVSEGLLSDLDEPLGHLASTVREVARTGDGEPELAYGAIVLIGLIANGLNPLQLARTAVRGLHLSALRGGPLDKKGRGPAFSISRVPLIKISSIAWPRSAARSLTREAA
jgi:hypothetical protein